MTVHKNVAIGALAQGMVAGQAGSPKPLPLLDLARMGSLALDAPMLDLRFNRRNCVLALCLLLSVFPCFAKKKNLPAVRWKAGAPGCEFQRRDDGKYRWRFVVDNLDMTLLMDSQELAASRRRLYKPLGVFMSVTYTGTGNYEFPADLRMEFVRHHNVIEASLDTEEFSTRMQNDVDTLIFETEHQIKKHPEQAEAKTNRAREYQKQVAEFLEFLSTQSLEPTTLNPGNPEAHGWRFFGTKNKWLGSWKDREDFILRVWMTDKIYEFPFSMPPTEGDLILRKREE
jgi:hypothetical protein